MCNIGEELETVDVRPDTVDAPASAEPSREELERPEPVETESEPEREAVTVRVR